ncbi:MAG: NADH:ubiquinone reductase (Na(+)-transporting) subunit B [Candidatus Marinimicrobia bacterium]|nr:NADH:ubiquinone reductase (Na(+)-transporting) subunit B [Candidatus Neomarinimicrobiota bacterium]|tara:strand:+ start:2220 stop:3404 length:1185 start_codon:yes stop_codon:yes gene_type:complete
MHWLRKYLDKIAPNFEHGGKLERLGPLYEATDTILFSTDIRTKSGPHIRDSVDIKRVMILVVISLLPCYLFGALNVGYQYSNAIGVNRTWIENLINGIFIIMPIIAVTFVSGAFWEILFALIRRHPISEGFLVTCALIPLTLPPSIPLWQVVIATSFGIVIGKEIFGGVGMNIFNPALTARAFLYFTYPAQISGDKVWVVSPDGFSGATALSIPAGKTDANAVDLLNEATASMVFDYSWNNMFMGWIPGSIGETNKWLIILSALFLILVGITNWRIMVASVAGLLITALIMNLFSNYSNNSMLTIPPHYHLVMGSFLFGIVFMATEPVTGAHTNSGRWIYGFLIGVLTVIIRSINPAYPEGIMLAILLMNAFAPLIDYFVIQGNIKKRMLRYAQ